MKKFFTLNFIIASYFFSSAQITIISNDFPVPGDTILQYHCTNCNSITPLSGGANVVWDFHDMQLVPSYSGLTRYSTTTFLNASLLAERGDNYEGTFIYYEAMHDSFNLIYYNYDFNAFHGWETKITYLDKRTQMIFPFTYNQSFVNAYRFYLDQYDWIPIYSYDYYGDGKDSVVCDGWGSLKLPFGTYDALRVHTINTSHDTDINVHAYVDHITEDYKWYVHGFKGPVMEMSSFNGVWSPYIFTPPGQSVIKVEELQGGRNIVCYMTEERGKFILKIYSKVPGNAQLVVFDMLGKTILEKEINISANGDESFPIDLIGYENAIYFLNVTGHDLNETFKMYNWK